jgi:peptidoglycan/LPS O-acetylase OafA/YrhL
MGLLRTLFAISVIFSHSPWHGALIGGRNAVQLFFIVSGFLMSLVLVERSTYPRARDFYVSRIIRLYPLYLTLCAVALLLHPQFGWVYRSAPLGADIVLVLANLFVVGQDWVMFLAVQHGDLVLTKDFLQTDVRLWNGLVLPQAWSLSIELMFYLIAPFVLKRVGLVLLLLFSSLALRAVFIGAGFGLNDPWTYRFFPTELALFLAGALAHRFLLPLYRKLPGNVSSTAPGGATLAFILICGAFPFYAPRFDENLLSLGLLLVFVAIVPLAFVFSSRSRLDSKIGDLSYPIYLCHTIVAWQINPLILARAGLVVDDVVLSLLNVAVSIALAYVVERYVGSRIEAYRSRVKSQLAGGRVSAGSPAVVAV